MTRLRSVPFVALCGLVGCGSISDQFSGDAVGSRSEQPPVTVNPGFDVTSPAQPVPTDFRPVVTAAKPPPPISGGTMLITRDGSKIVAADPDRDRVSVVGVAERSLLQTIALQAGDEPGRVAEDGAGRVHVALRRGGAVATIDLATGTVVARRAVCGAPRGIAYEAKTDLVHVACENGDLVSLPAAGGDATRRLSLGLDLRDVIVRDDGLVLTRFKSGEILHVDPSGAQTGSLLLRGITRQTDRPQVDSFSQSSFSLDPLEPAGAYRALSSADGSIFVLHQYGLASAIVLDPHQGVPDGGAPVTGPSAGFGVGGAPGTSTPYGAVAGTCGGLVHAAVSRVDSLGAVHMGAPMTAPVLAVDAAVSPDGQWILTANAGAHDPQAPTRDGMTTTTPGAVTVSSTGAPPQNADVGPTGCTVPTTFPINGQATAVVFNPRTDDSGRATNMWFAVQTREPAKIVFVRDLTDSSPVEISLGGDSVLDTGHDLFHRDAGQGIACASCHLEGAEDGRVWKFQPLGDRRTQAIHVGLEGTEPFHWDGDMKTFGMLMDEVMVRRMGGPNETDDRKNALKSWIFSLRPPAAAVDATSEAATRGQALFESPDVGCTSCHSGPKLTNSLSVNVGTTEPGHLLQVPSLHGIAYRAPFLHDGCAATLRDRFNPSCGGGDAHGHTSQLTSDQIDDLVAYLGTL
jgi:hypothetical protein